MIGVSYNKEHAIIPVSLILALRRALSASAQVAGDTTHGPAACQAHAMTWDPTDVSLIPLHPG